MENSPLVISSLKTNLAYVDSSDLSKVEMRDKIVESLKVWRFLVVTNVPGVKEMKEKVYNNVFKFPHIFTQNPHCGMQNYNNRFDLYGGMTQKEDGLYSFPYNEKDSAEL
jgi:hypothetical protein